MAEDDMESLAQAVNEFAYRAGQEFVTMRSEVAAAVQLLNQAVNSVPRMYIVADISARDALSGVNEGDQCQVKDASADPTVDVGSAIYVWSGAATGWVKVSENESMDRDMTVSSMPESMPDGLTDGGRLVVDISE